MKKTPPKKTNDFGKLVKPTITFSQLIVTPQVYQQIVSLKKIAARHSNSKSALVLFNGADGTGKTTAAAVIAAEAGKELLSVDMAAVVSKYIGETEKNIDVVFAKAAAKNYILFFDEADALFGKRSEVKDSHDRYANVPVDYLLSKIEEHKGLIVAAATDKNGLDPKFLQQVQTTISFRMPGYPARLKMWNNTLDEKLTASFKKEIDEIAKTHLTNTAGIYAMAQKINEQAAKTKNPTAVIFKKYLRR